VKKSIEYKIDSILLQFDSTNKPYFEVIIMPKEPVEDVTLFAVELPAKKYDETEFEKAVNEAVEKKVKKIIEEAEKYREELRKSNAMTRKYFPTILRLSKAFENKTLKIATAKNEGDEN